MHGYITMNAVKKLIYPSALLHIFIILLHIVKGRLINPTL